MITQRSTLLELMQATTVPKYNRTPQLLRSDMTLEP